MPTTTNYSQTYVTPLDPAFDGIWGPIYNSLHVFWDSELATRTINYNFADFELSRPTLVDYSEKINPLGSVSGAQSIDIESGNHVSITLTGDVTLTVTNPAAANNFCLLVLYVTQDTTGGRTLTFPSAFVDSSGANFAISGTAASSMTEVVAYTLDGGTAWYTKQGTTWT